MSAKPTPKVEVLATTAKRRATNPKETMKNRFSRVKVPSYVAVHISNLARHQIASHALKLARRICGGVTVGDNRVSIPLAARFCPSSLWNACRKVAVL